MGVSTHIRMFIVTCIFLLLLSYICAFDFFFYGMVRCGNSIDFVYPPFFLLRQVYWNKDVSLEDQKRVGGLKRRAGALKEENNRNGVFSEMAYATLQG